MKRLLIVLALCLVVVGIVAAPVLAKAEKVSLNPIGTDPGSGYVVFNDTSGPDNVQIEMSLKGALANTSYDVYVHIGAPDTYVATITTNAQGNANFHYSTSVAPGDQQVGLGLKRAGVWQFGTGLFIHTFK